MLQCLKGHKWNVTFDERCYGLMPGDACPLEISWDANKKVKKCGLFLSTVIHQKKEKQNKKVNKVGRRNEPYNRSKSKREWRE